MIITEHDVASGPSGSVLPAWMHGRDGQAMMEALTRGEIPEVKPESLAQLFGREVKSRLDWIAVEVGRLTGGEMRFQAFYKGSGGWISMLVSRHVITGLLIGSRLPGGFSRYAGDRTENWLNAANTALLWQNEM